MYLSTRTQIKKQIHLKSHFFKNNFTLLFHVYLNRKLFFIFLNIIKLMTNTCDKLITEI